MKIRYYLTRIDIIKASIQSIVYNRALMVYLCIFSLVMAGLSFRSIFEGGESLYLVIFSILFELAIIAILIVIGIIITTSLSLFLFGKGKGILGEHELEISNEGLIERTEFNVSLHKWKGVTAVRESSRFYFVRVNETGGAFHVIPKKDRMIEGDLGQFITEIRQKIL
jgi:uncharacterized membrane protein YdbT with pleckstrin-like domain